MSTGERLRLEYFDQNDDFERLLPREGIVEARLHSARGRAWTLLRLDEALAYEGESYRHVLLTHRHSDETVAPGAHVHILLVPAARSPVRDGFAHEDFLHVAWGLIGGREDRKPHRTGGSS